MNTNNNLERVKAAMTNISQSLQLPAHYPEDFDKDLETLSDSQGGKWLWLLRTCGTVLVPLNVGVHPVYINYWLQGSHGQKVVCFVVDTHTGLVTQATFDEAEKLVEQPPKNLHSSMSQEQLVHAVHAVLAHGCERRLWGMFESPTSIESFSSWQKWQSYFRSIDNSVMVEFMAKAVRFARAKQNLHGYAL